MTVPDTGAVTGVRSPAVRALSAPISTGSARRCPGTAEISTIATTPMNTSANRFPRRGPRSISTFTMRLPSASRSCPPGDARRRAAPDTSRVSLSALASEDFSRTGRHLRTPGRLSHGAGASTVARSLCGILIGQATVSSSMRSPRSRNGSKMMTKGFAMPRSPLISLQRRWGGMLRRRSRDFTRLPDRGR